MVAPLPCNTTPAALMEPVLLMAPLFTVVVCVTFPMTGFTNPTVAPSPTPSRETELPAPIAFTEAVEPEPAAVPTIPIDPKLETVAAPVKLLEDCVTAPKPCGGTTN